MQRGIWAYVLPMMLVAVFAVTAKANLVYPLRVFNSDIDDLNLFVELAFGGAGQISFSFYNNSSVESAIARIYFDDDADLLADIAAIDGLGLFRRSVSPPNLPGGRSIEPAFEAEEMLSLGAVPAPPKYGLNPGEWLDITFDIDSRLGLDDITEAIEQGMLRFGVHVIALPDGSSASAVNIPEPATLTLLAMGAAALFARKKRPTRSFLNRSSVLET